MKLAERLMTMDERVWRRHANPASGWSRVVTVLPLLSLAVWSRVWLCWGAVPLVLLALFWVWWNPRAFGEPERLDAWISKGVMGERIYLEHHSEIAPHHVKVARNLAWASAPGLLLWAYGLWALWWEAVVFGGLLGVLPKLWFIDRMVWIFEDWRRAGRPVPGVNDDELRDDFH